MWLGGGGFEGFGEDTGGSLTYTDVDARGVPRTRRVLPLEDQDAAFQAVLDGTAHPGLARFHQLLEREYAGVSRRQAAHCYAESANHQLHARASRANQSCDPSLANRPCAASSAT